MAVKLAVKPARAGMNLKHPVSGPLPDAGGRWLFDQFTAALIVEKTLERLTDDEIAAIEAAAGEETA